MATEKEAQVNVKNDVLIKDVRTLVHCETAILTNIYEINAHNVN